MIAANPDYSEFRRNEAAYGERISNRKHNQAMELNQMVENMRGANTERVANINAEVQREHTAVQKPYYEAHAADLMGQLPGKIKKGEAEVANLELQNKQGEKGLGYYDEIMKRNFATNDLANMASTAGVMSHFGHIKDAYDAYKKGELPPGLQNNPFFTGGKEGVAGISPSEVAKPTVATKATDYLKDSSPVIGALSEKTNARKRLENISLALPAIAGVGGTLVGGPAVGAMTAMAGEGMRQWALGDTEGNQLGRSANVLTAGLTGPAVGSVGKMIAKRFAKSPFKTIPGQKALPPYMGGY